MNAITPSGSAPLPALQPTTPAAVTSGGGTGSACATCGGAQAGAGAGAAALGGGDAMSGLAQALAGLAEAVAGLAKAVQAMQSGTQVAGVRGEAATADQLRGISSPKRTEPKGAATAKVVDEDAEFEQRVLDLVNAERAKRGLKAVQHDARLDAAAGAHAQHMAKVGKMAHDGIGDGDPGERIRKAGFRDAWGENVARGQRSPEQVVAEWMASPTHRENILDPGFTKLGVELRTAADGTNFWAQEFGA